MTGLENLRLSIACFIMPTWMLIALRDAIQAWNEREAINTLEADKIVKWLRARSNANYDPKWLADQIERGEFY
jgi:hypothetical protein